MPQTVRRYSQVFFAFPCVDGFVEQRLSNSANRCSRQRCRSNEKRGARTLIAEIGKWTGWGAGKIERAARQTGGVEFLGDMVQTVQGRIAGA